MLVVGVDSGLSGAFVFLDAETMRVAAVVDMPTLVVGKGRRGNKREISARTLVVEIENALGSKQVALAVVESVNSSPQMGSPPRLVLAEVWGLSTVLARL